MPEHQTWFRFLPGYEAIRAALEGRFGGTWYQHQTIDLQHVAGTVLVLAVIATLGIMVYRKVADARAAVVPEGKLTLRTFFEVVTEMVLREMQGQMDAKAARFFLPLIGTCAFFILFSNAMGLVPGFAPPTSNLNMTVVLAAVIVVASEIYGFSRHGIGYLMEFFGPLNRWYHFFTLIPLIIFVVEVISHVVRVMSLSVRLMANMYADHTVVGIFLTLIPLVPVLVPLPVQVLGVLVVVVQTAVFCLLSMVYIGIAAGEQEEHEASH